MNRLLLVISCLVALNVSSVHARSLVFLGKSVDDWQNALNSSDAALRRSAAFALGRMGEDARDAVPDLVSRLSDRNEDEKVRDMAASAIGDIARALKKDNGDAWQQSGGRLVQILQDDPSERVRRSAAYALGAFGPQAAGATKMLTKALADANASVRQNAAWGLGQIGPDARGAVDDLCKCLRDNNTLVRRDAATALGSMGKAGVRAGGPLIELVKSESDSVVRKMALDSLAHVAGPKQANSAKDLEPLLADKDPEIRFPAAIVLARIGGESAARALPVLSAALKGSDKQNRELAAASMSTLGPAARPAMHDLASALNDERNSVAVRGYAALAIAHIGPAAEPVVPAVVKALSRSQPDEVRFFTAEALAQIRYPANKKALPDLLDSIRNDRDGKVRQKCVWALFGMDKAEFQNSGAEKPLSKLLEERRPEMTMARYDAARKLAQVLNDGAPDATADVLLEMYRDRSLNVYKGTNANVEGSGTEASAGRANANPNLGGDARYLAVQALGFLGKKASKRKDVVKVIRQAAKDPDPTLRKTAQEALTDLGLD